jgi:hypothetical protein
MHGDKWQIQLNDSQHATYEDFSYLADIYGIREETHGLVNLLVGSVSGSRAIEVVADFLKALFECLVKRAKVGSVVAEANAPERA